MAQAFLWMFLACVQNDPPAPLLTVRTLGEEKRNDGPVQFKLIAGDLAIGLATPSSGKHAVVAHRISDARRLWAFDYDGAQNANPPILLGDADRIGVQGTKFMALLDAATGTPLIQKAFEPAPNAPQEGERGTFAGGTWMMFQGQDLLVCARDGKVLGTRKAATREGVSQLRSAGDLGIFRTYATKANPDKTESVVVGLAAWSAEGREVWRFAGLPYTDKLNNQPRKTTLGFTTWWAEPDWVVGMAGLAAGYKGIVLSAKTGKLQLMVDLPQNAGTGCPGQIQGRSVVALGDKSFFVWTGYPLQSGLAASRGGLWIFDIPGGKPVYASAADEYTQVIGASRELLILDDDKGRLRGLDPASKSVKWTYSGARSGPAILGAGWLAFARDQKMVVLDPGTGDQLRLFDFNLNEKFTWRVAAPAGIATLSNKNFGFMDGERQALGTLPASQPVGADAVFMHGLRDASGLRAIAATESAGTTTVLSFELQIKRP